MNFRHEYRMCCELQLVSGRKVIVDELNQERTYRGLLAGVPFAMVNDRMIEGDVKRAARTHANAPTLIPPTRRNFALTPGDMDDVHALGGRPVEWLPSVCCVASLHSGPVCADMDYSTVIVVWYQNEYALRIADEALSQILALDWEAISRDGEW